MSNRDAALADATLRRQAGAIGFALFFVLALACASSFRAAAIVYAIFSGVFGLAFVSGALRAARLEREGREEEERRAATAGLRAVASAMRAVESRAVALGDHDQPTFEPAAWPKPARIGGGEG